MKPGFKSRRAHSTITVVIALGRFSHKDNKPPVRSHLQVHIEDFIGVKPIGDLVSVLLKVDRREPETPEFCTLRDEETPPHSPPGLTPKYLKNNMGDGNRTADNCPEPRRPDIVTIDPQEDISQTPNNAFYEASFERCARK